MDAIFIIAQKTLGCMREIQMKHLQPLHCFIHMRIYAISIMRYVYIAYNIKYAYKY